MKLFFNEFSIWTYRIFSAKRKLHWTYQFEKGKTKTFLSRHVLLLAPYVPTFHIRLLLLDMSTFDIEHYSSGNENIHTKLFETSHPAGKQITTVNIFQLSLSTKMLSEVMFSWECQLIFLSIAILMVATFTFDLIEIFINWFFSKSPNTPT